MSELTAQLRIAAVFHQLESQKRNSDEETMLAAATRIEALESTCDEIVATIQSGARVNSKWILDALLNVLADSK